MVSIVTQQMYDELITLMEGTHFQSLNELCRHIISGKRVCANFIVGPPDKLLADLTTTYKELQQKCSEIDRISKIVYGEDSPEVLITSAGQARQTLSGVIELLESVQTQVTSISKRWIPGEEPDS